MITFNIAAISTLGLFSKTCTVENVMFYFLWRPLAQLPQFLLRLDEHSFPRQKGFAQNTSRFIPSIMFLPHTSKGTVILMLPLNRMN